MKDVIDQDEVIKDLLLTALEGGSNYWYMIEYHNTKDIKAESLYDTPLHSKGFIVFSLLEEDDDRTFLLNSEAITKGWNTIEDRFPMHLKDAIEENGDACTGDVFLQCCLFGGVVYG